MAQAWAQENRHRREIRAVAWADLNAALATAEQDWAKRARSSFEGAGEYPDPCDDYTD
jgi:hypothetical protein